MKFGLAKAPHRAKIFAGKGFYSVKKPARSQTKNPDKQDQWSMDGKLHRIVLHRQQIITHISSTLKKLLISPCTSGVVRSAVAQHFNSVNHLNKDLAIMVIERIHREDAEYRSRKEIHWIEMITSLTLDGLNLYSWTMTPTWFFLIHGVLEGNKSTVSQLSTRVSTITVIKD